MNHKPMFVLEIALLAFGVSLLAFYFVARASGEHERQEAIAMFTEARTAANFGEDQTAGAGWVEPGEYESNGRLPGNWIIGELQLDNTVYHSPHQLHRSAIRIQTHEASTSGAAEDETLPVALLRIDRVALEVPVYMDISERNLNRGAGLVDGTSLPDSNGNIAIAAHRDGYFRALADVAVGDVLELETLRSTREYRITGISIVMPTDLWPLDETDEPAVTLVTCYPFYFVGNAPQRYIVRAVAVE